MVERQISRRGVRSRRVVAAMESVPRERFVPAGLEEFAYDDTPLPIGSDQTISQPYVVALMIEAAEIEPGDKVLEVGAGSGYAAAVMSRIADRVYAIERHRALADAARERIERCGYRNVEIRHGDGTRGWPEAAPFDAIIVSAGGPSVPHALAEQLEIGGRLVIPVGEDRRSQRLLRITRIAAGKYEEEDLGGVMFVPLIGEQGWEDDARPAARPALRPLPEAIAEAAETLPDPGDEHFADAFERFGDRRVVLLGEASHGTAEFYRARAAITRRLIERYGFTIVAVEADWPDAAAIDRDISNRPRLHEGRPFRRFPGWMWRNAEMAEFLTWLRAHNSAVADASSQVGFYGLDLYNLSDAIAAVLAYLDAHDPAAAAIARERYGCLTPWQKEPASYARAALSEGYRDCEQAVVSQCRELLEKRLEFETRDGASFLDAIQSARLVASAEEYYRTMFYGGASSWNLRDRHMFETLENVLDARGAGARAVVWAHNSHIGDARHTEMGATRDEINIGQLCRERFGREAVLIGFGTHSGKVVAASEWDGPAEIRTVGPSHEESWERCCHESAVERFLLDFGRRPDLAGRLAEQRQERFIGVIYRPETELMSHYMEAALSRQFDAYVWFDETGPVTPLDRNAGGGEEMADTFPFGL